MENNEMNYAKVTPADLRSDAEKLYARADALEEGLKFFEGKICELCGGTKRHTRSSRCVNTREHIDNSLLVENLREKKTNQLSTRAWR
tara:strand:- start:347 stop:610 length:264 start_codon:yes stop_codon:yes gene_type:complete